MAEFGENGAKFFSEEYSGRTRRNRYKLQQGSFWLDIRTTMRVSSTGIVYKESLLEVLKIWVDNSLSNLM